MKQKTKRRALKRQQEAERQNNLKAERKKKQEEGEEINYNERLQRNKSFAFVNRSKKRW